MKIALFLIFFCILFVPPIRPNEENSHFNKVNLLNVIRKWNENKLSTDIWSNQVFPPLRKARNKYMPVTVSVPSKKPAEPPMKFMNNYQLIDFNIPPLSIASGKFSELYTGYLETRNGSFPVWTKRSKTGYENLLYQDAQVMKALEGYKEFPQVIFYDGRNLVTTQLCTTWNQYAVAQFNRGGMTIEDGYMMMNQMIDACRHMHSLGYVHRDISPNNIAFGCNWYKNAAERKSPFKLSETSQLYLFEFGATENVERPILDKIFWFAGSWDFVSNGTLHDEDPMYVQDVESLGYLLLYSLNGGLLTWSSFDGRIDLAQNIAKKAELDLDANLLRMRGDAEDVAKAKRDISKYFGMIREHARTHPTELLDYDALKACFNLTEK